MQGGGWGCRRGGEGKSQEVRERVVGPDRAKDSVCAGRGWGSVTAAAMIRDGRCVDCC